MAEKKVANKTAQCIRKCQFLLGIYQLGKYYSFPAELKLTHHFNDPYEGLIEMNEDAAPHVDEGLTPVEVPSA